MDVSFEEIYQLGTDCSRYLPLLNERILPPKSLDLYRLLKTARKDLSTLPTQDFWAIFLEFYIIAGYLESRDGAVVFFYHLKPNVSFNLPSDFAMIRTAPVSGVKFEPDAVYLESKPTPGRLKEYLVFEGEFEFNESTLFNPRWRRCSVPYVR